MPNVLAIAAHPDDIEFVMAGTMALLKRANWNLHCFNLADGSRGSAKFDGPATARIRASEAQSAAAVLGAIWHPPLCPDIEICYSQDLLRRVAAIVRTVDPQIILTHSPVDYMIDHEETSKLAATAAFVRGMPNFQTTPSIEPVLGQIAIYHAQPHGNRTPLGELVFPDFAINISSVLEVKRAALAAHESQLSWLDKSQRMTSHVQTMEQFTREVGRFTGQTEFAEGWRQRHYLGYSDAGFRPLQSALSEWLLPVKTQNTEHE